jgi:hypothetical protein
MMAQQNTPGPEVTVITPTPQPPDIFAAATQSVRLTEQAQREGTPTPLPPNIRIATRTPTPRVVTATPTPANSATATFHAVQETAIALTTGTPYVLVATSTPTLTPTPTRVIVTPTPQPANVFEAATRKAELTLQEQRGGTPTPLPKNYVVATVTQTPRVVTNTPPPANDATATAHTLHATAVAYTTGVPNVVTATPTITATVRATSQTTPTQTLQPADPQTGSADAALAQQPTVAQSPTAELISTPEQSPIAVPTITPTALPTSVTADAPEFMPVPEWTNVYRIRFRRGRTSATIHGHVNLEQPARFVLRARSGRSMTVLLQNQGGYLARVDISSESGELLGTAYTGESWSAVLPATQKYYLTIRMPVGGKAHDFSLWVEVLP